MEVMLITGCAGFIGRAAWKRFASQYKLIGIDSMVRPIAQEPPQINDSEFFCADINNIDTLPLPRADIVLHLAAQTSVTRSCTAAQSDFETNAAGTFAVAQWARRQAAHTLIYSSTNKVYGSLPGIAAPIHDDQPLNPKTPYGISKATGGMYVREFLPDASFDMRQSCIYGETQRGSEDQGWVAHVAALIKENKPITCFGDGEQVRDLLHVDDLLNAFQMAIARQITPGSYTIGGGQENALSFAEAVSLLGGSIATHEQWRPCDQKYFVSANDLTRFGWLPRKKAKEYVLRFMQ